jgi:arylformamidase
MAVKLIDLSLGIYHGAPTFTYDPKCAVIVHNTIDAIGYNITQISMSTHQGTHLDAPYHFFDTGITVDELSLESFAGKALKIDMRHKNPKEPLAVEDFLPYEKKIAKGSRIIFQTGWDRIFPEKSYFTDFPYLSVELAKWFVKKEIIMLGMDIPTPNPADWMEVHKLLLGNGIVIVEGLAGLDKLSQDEFFFIAAPLKLLHRDGSPVRAIAVEGDNYL